MSAINTSYAGGLSDSRPSSVHSSQNKYRSPLSTITNICTPTSMTNIRKTPKCLDSILGAPLVVLCLAVLYLMLQILIALHIMSQIRGKREVVVLSLLT
ncbi:uncharacterized protein LOC141719715 isoform X2 [Apium graveolens]|uniref:uncharacterized protein LOC141719715 isoform X2 n=1 Tax=Apium graveolens TaxID=4045 RepID=UPI003D7BCAB0